MKTWLNIVVTHFNEPWELGRPFFDMLEHQLSVDMSKVSITLVQDGHEFALQWSELLSGYSYNVNVITIKHAGTAAARNAALDACTSDWIMFCNFDDMLADIASLSMMINHFPTDEYDIIWTKLIQQCKWFTGHIYLNCNSGPNFSNTDGKMYRTAFLNEKNIRFITEPRLHYEQMFNAVALTETAPFRIVALTTDFYPYAKTFRPDSLKHTPEAFDELNNTIIHRDTIISDELKRRGLDFAYKRSVVKTICGEYYETYCPDKEKNTQQFTPGFLNFYRDNRDTFRSVPMPDIDAIKSEAEIEKLEIIQARYNEHKQEYYFKNDTISFEQWLQNLDGIIDGTAIQPAPNPVQTPQQYHDIQSTIIDNTPIVHDFSPKPAHEPRVIVYCGTYDVYLNMIASLKSVLCNIPVDKVYFICEDDQFPYELPDIVECINVKNQQYFPEDGPNYNNSWTYMCMIRAAFPEMFPQYSKILSLDIDIVMNDNVADLWDYDISDYYLAGVPEKQRQKSSTDPLYINFGVVMMNLDKLRKDNIQQQLIDALNTKHFGCPEQDAFNKLCAYHILELPADYNYTTYSHITGDALNERIIHYAGQKFWRHYSLVKQYADLGWSAVMERQRKLKEGEQNER